MPRSSRSMGSARMAELEFELFDALPDIFLANRYFDVFIEYAKADAEDILLHHGDQSRP